MIKKVRSSRKIGIMLIRYLAGLSLVMLLWSCDKHEDECVVVPDTKGSEVSVTIEQFQDTLANLKDKQQLVDLLKRQQVIMYSMFGRPGYPDDSTFLNAVYSRLGNIHIDTLLRETHRVFGDLSGLEEQFEEAFTNLRYYYPEFKIPRVQTVITGLDTDMYVSDSLIVIGLDYYLGADGRYRPQVYDYQLRKYDPDDIVPSIMMIYGINDSINKTQLNDKTVLADMIAYGKSFYFAKHMLPCVPDSVFMWYTPQEINGSTRNEELIWSRFVESQVLFSTSHSIKKDYLAERPVTVQVGDKCPGRIGQWVGWQIVKKYMKSHSDISLQQLMATPDAQAIFRSSAYRPEN
jgi:hypothetical protein